VALVQDIQAVGGWWWPQLLTGGGEEKEESYIGILFGILK